MFTSCACQITETGRKMQFSKQLISFDSCRCAIRKSQETFVDDGSSRRVVGSSQSKSVDQETQTPSIMEILPAKTSPDVCSSNKLLTDVKEYVVHPNKAVVNLINLPMYQQENEQIDADLSCTQELDPVRIEVDDKMEKGFLPSVMIKECTNTAGLACPQPILIKDEKNIYLGDVNDCNTVLAEHWTHNIQECVQEYETEDVQLIAMSIVTYDEDVKQNAGKWLQDTTTCHEQTRLNRKTMDTMYSDFNGLNSQLISHTIVGSHTVPNTASQLNKKKMPKKRGKDIGIFPVETVEPTMKIGMCSRTYSKKTQHSVNSQESVTGKKACTTSVCRGTEVSTAQSTAVSIAQTSKGGSKTQLKPINAVTKKSNPQGNDCRNVTNSDIDIDNTIVNSASSSTISDPFLQTTDCDSISNNTQRKTTKLFRCTVCSLTFPVFALCVEHLKTHTDKEVISAHSKREDARRLIKRKTFLCDICGIAFPAMFPLTRHIEKHYGSHVYNCGECEPEKPFTAKCSLKCHINVKHGKGITCSYCDRIFSSVHLFNEHKKTHYNVIPRPRSGRKKKNIVRKCIICSKVFKSNSALKQHLRTHTGETPFKCSYCPRKFSNSANMAQHECLHTGQKPYKCTKCDMTFLYSVPRKIHMLTHSIEMGDGDNIVNSKK